MNMQPFNHATAQVFFLDAPRQVFSLFTMCVSMATLFFFCSSASPQTVDGLEESEIFGRPHALLSSTSRFSKGTSMLCGVAGGIVGRRRVFRKTSRVAHGRPARPAGLDKQRHRHAKTRGLVSQTSDASMHGLGRMLSKDPVTKVWEESEVSIQGRR